MSVGLGLGLAFCVFCGLACCLQCFDAVGWADEGHPACKNTEW